MTHTTHNREQGKEVVICGQHPEAYWFDGYQGIMEVISLGAERGSDLRSS